MKHILVTILSIIFFSGCFFSDNKVLKKITNNTNSQAVEVVNNKYTKSYTNTNKIYQNLNGAIVSVADQLFASNTDKEKITSVILTSFTDLDQLNKTTTFGRLLSESMFNELHIRKFHVTDFRGQDAVSVNADGEFHITRDINKLKDHIEATEYILVGTYVKFENESLLINARIIDSQSGSIISTARVIYKPSDCKLFDICEKKVEQPKHDKTFGINIISDYD